MWAVIISFFCTLFGGCETAPAKLTQTATPCSVVKHGGESYTVCRFDVDDVDIALHWKGKSGEPFRTITRLQKALESQNAQPLMLMNGGMYHDDLRPVGLYIENTKQSARISTKGGWGNFHLLPNGVFWIKGGKPGVTETKRFIKRRIKPDFATQSGPMLVINGKLHPRFLPRSNSLKIRNGVGVSRSGETLFFAISQRRVSFHAFGTLFRDVLKTPNALYLDGTVSALKSPSHSQGGWRELGPMISIVAKAEPSAAPNPGDKTPLNNTKAAKQP